MPPEGLHLARNSCLVLRGFINNPAAHNSHLTVDRVLAAGNAVIING
jgi:hypothetical protein